MQLVLAVPPTWPGRVVDGRRVVQAPSGVAVEVASLVPLPDDARAWVVAEMTRDLPPGATVRPLQDQEGRSALGWPMRLAVAAVVGADGALVEHRLGAFYELHEWAGDAIARVPAAVPLDGVRDEILGLLASGRPSWKDRDLVAAIGELWS